MSGPPSSTGPVRLIVAERSENAANAIDSRLRDAGIATRFQYVDDLSLALEQIGETDLLLCNASLDGTATAIPELRKAAPKLPIVLLTADADQPINAEQGMLMGANDVVPFDQRERLLLVCQRELGSRWQSRQFTELHSALAEAEQRCQLLLESSRAAIAYVHEGMHIYANAGYIKLFGFGDSDDVEGLPLMDLLDAETNIALKKTLKVMRQKGSDADEATLDFVGFDNNGDEISGQMTLAPAEYEGEDCIQVTLRPTPVQAVAPVAAQKSDAPPADTDSAEAAPAPTYSVGDFVAQLGQATDNSGCHAVFVAELDSLEQQIQEHGLRGVELICDRIALTLQGAIDGAPFARVSNHQFAFVAVGQDRESTTEIADDARQLIENLLLEINEKTVRPTLSIGGSEIEASAGGEHALDAAFWQLRSLCDSTDDGESKNQIALAAGSEASQINDEAARILQLINEAIEKQRFRLLFQPIISLKGDSDEHYEVFLRMLDRGGEILVPNQFLRTAIENNVAGKIDRWVVLQSIKQLSAHRGRGHSTRLTINLTCNSVTDKDFIAWLGVAIKAARLPKDAVIFQVTEEDATTYLRQTREFIDGLRAMHCATSLSRFRATSESFEQLNHFPVDMVKMDGKLVDGMETNDKVRTHLLDSIKELQNLGKLTVVPMVESAQTLSTLWQAGANYIQGHYLQEPAPEMAYDFTTDE